MQTNNTFITKYFQNTTFNVKFQRSLNIVWDHDGDEPGGRKRCLAQVAKREDQKGQLVSLPDSGRR